MSEPDPRALAGLLASFQRRDPAALEQIETAVAMGATHPHLILAQSELAIEAGRPQPLGLLERAVAQAPAWIEGQRQLASLRFETESEGDFARSLRTAIDSAPHNPHLWNALIGALVDAGELGAAADCARDARARFDVPELMLIEANHASADGQFSRADTLFAAVPKPLLEQETAFARHCIRTGRLGEAGRILELVLVSKPLDRAVWALVEPVWRATGDARSGWLSAEPAFCRVQELDSGKAEMDAFAEACRRLHVLRSRPLGHSARGGTQTRGSLFDRAEPWVAALRALLQGALDAYRSALPRVDPAHPLLAFRDRALRVAGGWSVRLTGDGFHVPHVHPAGIVSSACYFSVPPPEGEAGYLEIGRPPPDLHLDLPPLRTIAPRPGRLVLFPSFIYHGTRRFSAGERLSVAFDAVA